jgi:hypothetical protein
MICALLYQNIETIRESLGRAMAQAVSRLPTRKPGFDPGTVHVGFVVDKVALGQVCPPSISVFPCPFHSTGAPLLGKIKKTNHLSLHLHHRIVK